MQTGKTEPTTLSSAVTEQIRLTFATEVDRHVAHDMAHVMLEDGAAWRTAVILLTTITVFLSLAVFGGQAIGERSETLSAVFFFSTMVLCGLTTYGLLERKRRRKEAMLVAIANGDPRKEQILLEVRAIVRRNVEIDDMMA